MVFPYKLKSILLAIVIATALLLGGCSQAPEQPIRVGTNIWLGYEPLYLAQSLGYFKSNEVKLVQYISASQTMRSIVDGTVEAAALTLDEALLLQQFGVDARVVLVMDYSNGADKVITRPDINNLKELRGKRIGVETSALGAYMMHRVLEKADLSLNDVKLVSLSLAEHEQAYLNGDVDALVTFDPVSSRLMKLGAHTLFDSSEMPGEVVDVLVVRNDYLMENKEHLKKLLAGWFRAIEYFDDYPEKSARYMNARMKMGEEQLLSGFRGVVLPKSKENRRLLSGKPTPLSVQAEKLADVMAENKLLRGPAQANKLFDPELLQELYP